MDWLATTVNQKQRRFIGGLSLTKAAELSSADMKTGIHLKDAFFFALQNECCHERQNKTQPSKGKQNEWGRGKHLFVYAVSCDSNLPYYQQGPTPALLLHTGLHFPPG